MRSSASENLSSIISSEARFRVLQVLASVPAGLKLRELERATGLSIRSIQVATEGLVAERVLQKSKTDAFQFNPKLVLAQKVKRLFLFLRDEELREKAHALSERAKQVVRLSEEVARFVNNPGGPR